MKSLLRCSFVLSAVLIAFHLNAQSASAAKFNGTIDGLEFAAQTADHGALFLFEFNGKVNGRRASGIGLIEVFHTPLGDQLGDLSAVTGGSGVIFIGLRKFPVTINGDGTIVLVNLNNPLIFDDDFLVTLTAEIGGQGGITNHAVQVLLSHKTLIPTIKGTIVSL